MKKENGRLKPATPNEVAAAKINGKMFVCVYCGHTERKFKVEFAEEFICSKCNKGSMVEKV
jgi:transcription initiation factor IIE alpha subunit